MKIPFGCCVAGPTNKEKDDSTPIALYSVFKFNLTDDKTDLDQHQQAKRFWASESYGFGNAGDSLESFKDKRALEIWKGSTKFGEGRHKAGLVWSSNGS